MKKKQKYSHKWFVVGLLSMVLAAPNGTIIKYWGGDLDVYVFNALRFGILSVLCLPFLVKNIPKLSSKNIKYAVLAGLFMTIAVISYVYALQYGPASYVSMLTLISPIVFVVYSVKLTGDKITNQAIAGITLAALGAFLVVFLPVALEQSAELKFYPVATLLMLFNAFTFPLALIYSKKSNQAGISLLSVMGISSIVVFAICLVLALIFSGWNPQEFTGKAIFTVFYSGVVVALFARALNIASYERIGAAVTSALAYLEVLMAISVPIVLFDEELSIGMVIGGALILLGVYVVEHRKAIHSKHYFIHRHH